jgi:NAD(P)-dependent dehydrogenase (short-subunit alcohol dehydrogenase family)
MNDDKTWAGRVVAITGGNSGIGRALAQRVNHGGGAVAIFGRDTGTVAATVADLDDALGEVGDVGEAADLDRWYAAIGERWGRVDALVVNASIGRLSPIEQVTAEDLRASFDVNAIGAFLTVQRALGLLGEGSTVTFTTSANAVLSQPGSSVYAATKAAQGALLRVFAMELLPLGIRVNGVQPGPVDTPMWDRLGMPADALHETKAAVASSVPAGRFATPDEVAAAIAFLAGPESSYVVGEELAVDGGLRRR